MPENRLSTTPVSSAFVSVEALEANSIISRELGGIGLNDTSEGLIYQTWTAQIRHNTLNALDEIVLSAGNYPETVIYSGNNITSVSISFDRNMNLHYVYIEDGVTKLNWFDSLAEAQVITEYGDTLVTPKLFLDDKRDNQDFSSDILFCYLEEGTLKHRQQRDRFLTSYTLQDNLGDEASLVRVGMNTNNRVQFEIFG